VELVDVAELAAAEALVSRDELPTTLAELHALPFDYRGGEGIDFEPYDHFLSAAETRAWIRAWTGNEQIDGAQFRVFGQDGTGGYAAIWRVDPEQPLLDQPVVFFGSEGEVGVVARDVFDYLWLLAGDTGPLEAVEYGDSGRAPNERFTAFAAKYAPKSKKSVSEVLAAARAAYPQFEQHVRTLCR
jgi:hypothetical protein